MCICVYISYFNNPQCLQPQAADFHVHMLQVDCCCYFQLYLQLRRQLLSLTSVRVLKSNTHEDAAVVYDMQCWMNAYAFILVSIVKYTCLQTPTQARLQTYICKLLHIYFNKISPKSIGRLCPKPYTMSKAMYMCMCICWVGQCE